MEKLRKKKNSGYAICSGRSSRKIRLKQIQKILLKMNQNYWSGQKVTTNKFCILLLGLCERQIPVILHGKQPERGSHHYAGYRSDVKVHAGGKQPEKHHYA